MLLAAGEGYRSKDSKAITYSQKSSLRRCPPAINASAFGAPYGEHGEVGAYHPDEGGELGSENRVVSHDERGASLRGDLEVVVR